MDNWVTRELINGPDRAWRRHWNHWQGARRAHTGCTQPTSNKASDFKGKQGDGRTVGRLTRGDLAAAALAMVLTCAGGVMGCGDLELGDAPFKCNVGKPKCPNGYECKSNVCVREGECPWPAVATCPAPPPKGKFCNGLQLKTGAPLTMILQVGTVPMEAVTVKCSPCRNLPAGEQTTSLFIKGDSKPVKTTKLHVQGGKDYMYWSALDSSNEALIKRIEIPSKFTCDEAVSA